jgi:uncharacterized protein
LVEELMKVSNMFGYGEVNQYNRLSSLQSVYKKMEDEKFRLYILRKNTDVFNALKVFFQKEYNNKFMEEIKVK